MTDSNNNEDKITNDLSQKAPKRRMSWDERKFNFIELHRHFDKWKKLKTLYLHCSIISGVICIFSLAIGVYLFIEKSDSLQSYTVTIITTCVLGTGSLGTFAKSLTSLKGFITENNDKKDDKKIDTENSSIDNIIERSRRNCPKKLDSLEKSPLLFMKQLNQNINVMMFLHEMMMNEDCENYKDDKVNEKDKPKTNANNKQENNKNDKVNKMDNILDDSVYHMMKNVRKYIFTKYQKDEKMQYNVEERHYVFAILVLMIVAANKTSNIVKSINKGNEEINCKCLKCLVRDMKILVEKCANKEHSEENQNKTSSADNLINKSLSNSKSKIIESLNDKKMNVNVNVSMDTIEVNIRVVLLEIMKTSDWIETQIDTQNEKNIKNEMDQLNKSIEKLRSNLISMKDDL
ncbi:32151_t:CDS:2, partial [Gigaspora margarita]